LGAKPPQKYEVVFEQVLSITQTAPGKDSDLTNPMAHIEYQLGGIHGMPLLFCLLMDEQISTRTAITLE
jgi:hypothetical protein